MGLGVLLIAIIVEKAPQTMLVLSAPLIIIIRLVAIIIILVIVLVVSVSVHRCTQIVGTL